MNIVIPLAGLGTRFHKTHPNTHKPFIDVNGIPMIEVVIRNNNHASNTKFIFIIRKELPVNFLCDVCKKLNINFEIVTIDYVTSGPAETCFLAESYINNDQPLIITNCDQVTEDLNINNILTYVAYHKCDGVLGTYNSKASNNSFVKINDNYEVLEVKEKQVISNIASNGFYFWTKGSLFIETCKLMFKNKDMYNNEYYVAPTYNYLIQEKYKIKTYHFNLHFPIGTPDDLNKYLDYANNKN